MGASYSTDQIHFCIREEEIGVKETATTGINGERKAVRWSWKTWFAGVCSILVSLLRGVIFVFSRVKRHWTNTQLWMVPVDLILFSTSVFIWVTYILSNLCRPRDPVTGVTACSANYSFSH